jgi:hypothetical protein
MSGSGAAVLRAVMAGVQAAVAVIDDAGRVVEANERRLAVGPPPGADWREIVHPADRGLAPARPGPPAEVRVGLRGGASRWFSVVLERADGAGRAAIAQFDGSRTARLLGRWSADPSLYAAKAAGRDRTMAAGSP